jgi:hypothetical protein
MKGKDAQSWLSPETVYEILKEVFPKQNDFFECSYYEETEELEYFEINSIDKLRSLLLRRRQEIMEIDQSPMDEIHINHYKQELGKEIVEERLKNNYWFAYPALLRLALELEFGERYKIYSEARYGII